MFAAAGYGTLQQATAIANAKAESSLDPSAVSPPPEHSVGLFQLNMKNGLGVGHTEAELQDPASNIRITIAACQKLPSFASAPDVTTANKIFVSEIENPADLATQTAKRLAIAQSLIS
jgi:hypothetical protein